MSFTVYPAIDVRDGRVVRLAQGDYARETRYAADPLAQALAYADAGARWLHLVDLDAAREGGYTLLPLLRAIAEDGRLQVQTGGGVRSATDALEPTTVRSSSASAESRDSSSPVRVRSKKAWSRCIRRS